MKSFKDFLTEVEKNFTERRSNFTGAHVGYNHHFEVGPHRVHVIYNKQHKQNYSVAFAVNGSLHHFGSHVSSEHKHKIAHAVMGSVRHFINEYKPKTLTAKGNTKQKSSLYKKFWHHVAKNHPDYRAHHGGWGHVNGIRRWRDDPKPEKAAKPKPIKASQQRYHNPNQLRLDV